MGPVRRAQRLLGPAAGCEAGSTRCWSRNGSGAAGSAHASNQQYFDEEAQGSPRRCCTPPPAPRTNDPGRLPLDPRARTRRARTRSSPRSSADDALLRLQASTLHRAPARRDHRHRRVQLKAYGHPAAAGTAARATGMTPAALFDPAGGRERSTSSPGASISSCSRRSSSRCSARCCSGSPSRRTAPARPLAPPALFALDETANIAPLRGAAADPRHLPVSGRALPHRLAFGRAAAPPLRRRRRRGDPLALPGQGVPRLDHRPLHPPGLLVELLGRRQPRRHTRAGRPSTS